MSVFQVEISNLFISYGHDFRGHHGMPRGNHPVDSVESIDCVQGLGIKGDRYFNYKEDFKGQITFFDSSLHIEIKEKFHHPDLCPSAFRRNVIVKGLDLNSLIGKEFSINGVRLSGSEECKPCYWMDEAVGKGIEDFLKGRGGLRCRILSNGSLSLGRQMLTVHEGTDPKQ
jgi:MOSC domain-containing protein YiiM